MFGSDRAVSDASQDRFGRAQFAERVARVIGTRTDPSSLVVGLYGPWGEGKTSLLNFIRQNLETYSLVTCVQFNPWRFDDEDALLQGFFHTLADALNARLSTKVEALGKLVKDYSSVLKLGHAGLADVANLAGATMSDISMDKLRQRISALLSESHVCIVVLIDDVDRMEKREIQALFRLVKLTGDFDNTAYILAFDDEMVARAVGERFSSKSSDVVEAGRNFLEKIIQVPLHIPAAKRGKVRAYCLEMLDKALEDLSVVLSQDEISTFVSLFDQGLLWSVTTPRLAVRYVNAVRFALGLMYTEVNSSDLLLLEGIRALLPSLYQEIRKNQELFLNGPTSEDGSKQKQTLDEFIRAALPACKPESIVKVRQLLEGLFPRTTGVGYMSDWDRVWAKEKRIASRDYFERYFTYAIDDTDISDRRLTEFLFGLEHPSAERTALVELLTKQNVELVLTKLRSTVSTIDSMAAGVLANEVASNAELYPDLKVGFGRSTYTQAAMLVADCVKQVKAGERSYIVVELIKTSNHLAFLNECLRWVSVSKEANSDTKIFDEGTQREFSVQLADRIKNLEAVKTGAWDFSNQHSLQLLYAWVWGTNHEEVSDFLLGQFKARPASIFPFLRRALGSAWDANTGIPFEPKFERNSYNSIAGLVDAGKLAILIEASDGFVLENSDTYSRKPDTDNEIGTRFLKIHKAVKQEGKESDIGSEGDD